MQTRARDISVCEFESGKPPTNLSWPANAGHPGDVFSSSFKKIVMARFMRATHGNRRDASMGGPDEPGHDDFFEDEGKMSPGWPAFAGHDTEVDYFFRPASAKRKRSLVEPSGIEPLTSCMPCRRSPS
jgi:hypothetical protein